MLELAEWLPGALVATRGATPCEFALRATRSMGRLQYGATRGVNPTDGGSPGGSPETCRSASCGGRPTRCTGGGPAVGPLWRPRGDRAVTLLARPPVGGSTGPGAG